MKKMGKKTEGTTRDNPIYINARDSEVVSVRYGARCPYCGKVNEIHDSYDPFSYDQTSSRICGKCEKKFYIEVQW